MNIPANFPIRNKPNEIEQIEFYQYDISGNCIYNYTMETAIRTAKKLNNKVIYTTPKNNLRIVLKLK